MYANDFTAIGASPFFFFMCDKFPDAEFFYIFQIFDHAHGIFASVTFVNVFYQRTGILAAEITKFILPGNSCCAILDATLCTGFCLQIIRPLTTRATVFLSDVGIAQTAIHAAGRYLQRINGFLGYGSFIFHFCQTPGHWLVVSIPLFLNSPVAG